MASLPDLLPRRCSPWRTPRGRSFDREDETSWLSCAYLSRTWSVLNLSLDLHRQNNLLSATSFFCRKMFAREYPRHRSPWSHRHFIGLRRDIIDPYSWLDSHHLATKDSSVYFSHPSVSPKISIPYKNRHLSHIQRTLDEHSRSQLR